MHIKEILIRAFPKWTKFSSIKVEVEFGIHEFSDQPLIFFYQSSFKTDAEIFRAQDNKMARRSRTRSSKRRKEHTQPNTSQQYTHFWCFAEALSY